MPENFFKRSANGEQPEEKTGENDAREHAFVSPRKMSAIREGIEAQELPVRKRFNELVDAIVDSYKRTGCLLFQGATGSGKSVYSPWAMRVALKRLGLRDRIVMMQPRKDAARGVAIATAAVQKEELGHGVGYATSEMKVFGPKEAVRVVTSGIFLRYMSQGSLTKRDVGAVIIDEMHEGSADYHLVLGLIRQMQDRGEAPLVLLTSATLNKELVMDYFGLDEADYLTIEGRAHHVDKRRLREYEADLESGRPWNYLEETARIVGEICDDEDDEGDVLVFLPGQAEIEDVRAQLSYLKNVEILPLYSNLKPEDRDKVLLTERDTDVSRRVVLGTNVAESSLTVPNIVFVVSSMRKRVVRFNPKTGVLEETTELISKDEADQQAGRAGRLCSGVAYQLITREDYQELPDHPEPEVLRTNLSHLVLQLRQMGIQDELTFPFIQPPNRANLKAGVAELKNLGALDPDGNLTELGHQMADLPFEPRIGIMVIESIHAGCPEVGLVMAAFSREENVLLGPSKQDIDRAPGHSPEVKKRAARQAVRSIQAEFMKDGSDWLTTLRVFQEAVRRRVFEVGRIVTIAPGSRTPDQRKIYAEFREWCEAHHFKMQALTHIAYKLREYARYAKVKLNRERLAERLQIDGALREKINKIILKSHPDLLYRRNPDGSADQFFFPVAGDESPALQLSMGSSALRTGSPLCVIAGVREGGGTNGFGSGSNFGEKVHPVDLEDVIKALPTDRILCKPVPGLGDFLFVNDDSTTDRDAPGFLDVFFIRPDGTKVGLGVHETIFTVDQKVTALAQFLIANSTLYAATRRNAQILEDAGLPIQDLTHPGRATVANALERYYVRRLTELGNVTSLRAVGNLSDTVLQAELDEILPETERKRIEKEYSKHISINERTYPIRYELRRTWSMSPDEEPKPTAVISMRPQDVLKLKREDVPNMLKNKEAQLVVYLEVPFTILGIKKARARDLIEFQQVVRGLYEEEQRMLKERHAQRQREQRYAQPPQGPGHSDGILGRALRNARIENLPARRPPNEEGKPGKEPTEPAHPPKRRIESTWTPETVAVMQDEIDKIHILITGLVTLSSTPAESDPSQKKASEAIRQDKKNKWTPAYNELREVLATDKKDDPLESFRGKVSSLRGTVEASYKKHAHHFVDGYNQKWIQNFERAWNAIPGIMDDDTEMAEYLSAGLVDREEVLQRMHARLEEELPQMQKAGATPIDLQSYLKQILDKY